MMLSQLFKQAAKSRNFVYKENFLTSSECDLLVGCFERYSHLTFKNPTGDSFFDHRYLWINMLPTTESEAKRLMQAFRYRIIDELRSFYNEQELYEGCA